MKISLVFKLDWTTASQKEMPRRQTGHFGLRALAIFSFLASVVKLITLLH